MKIKNSLLAISSVAAFLSVQSVFAAPVNLTSGDQVKLEWSADSYGHNFGGGEFKATGTSVLNGPGDSFLTFCLEYVEHIGLGTSYFVNINTAAVNGGGGAVPIVGPHPYDPSATTYDPLSSSTAWLYTQFRNNALAGFYYSGTDAQKNASGNSLQLSIWKLEGELTDASVLAAYNADGQAQSWVAAANSSGWTGLGNVRVMNLYDSYNASTGVFSGGHQDQLYMMPTPVPEPESYAMLLAGLGLLGWATRRRKQRS